MTVTRKQGEATDNALAHRPNDSLVTSNKHSQPSQIWLGIVLQIAQDKRHDLAAPTLRFWKEKLKNFQDNTVCEALLSGQWEFFPSVDQVIKEIDLINERKRHENANRDWQQWKANLKRAKTEGLLATEQDYEEMRAALRKYYGDPTAKQPGKREAE